MDKKKWLKRGGWSVYLLWHLIFVIMAVALIIPYLLLPMANNAWIDAAPWSYVIYTAIIVALPFLSLLIVWRYFRADVVAALKLFYAVELPLMLLLLLRVTLFRDTPLAGQMLFLNISLGLAAYFYFLLPHTAQRFFSLNRSVSLGLSSLIALVGLYFGVLLGLYFLPYGLMMVEHVFDNIGQFNWADVGDFMARLFKNPLIMLFVLLVFATVGFFLITPLVLIVAYLHQYLLVCRQQSFLAIAAIGLLLCFIEAGLFGLTYQQPQTQAFALTASLPEDVASRQLLLAEQEGIKAGLVNAYLAAYRYISSTQKSNALSRSYAKVFGQGLITDTAQPFFNALASPFLYQGGSFESAKMLAAQRYQQFFDTPIEKDQKEAILAAVKATWEDEQNQAGLMNAASEYVLLTQQSITLEEKAEFAIITINQVLVNQTFQAQEVVLHFQLPEDAVVTGLWMSDDIQNPEKFEHVISPRGAAQAVYKAEVSRRVDPALMEKVGPLQYRLRAFPIPARQKDKRSEGNRYQQAFRDFSASAASVQFQYTVSIDSEGHWPLPILLEKRNVYWDDETQRSHVSKNGTAWLPEYLLPTTAVTAQRHKIILDEGEIVAVPRYEDQPSGSLSKPVAIIIDGSYSMHAQKLQLVKALAGLKSSTYTYDLFFCQSSCTAITDDALEQQVFFGNSQLLQQLAQWSSEHDAKDYAAIMVLSDAGSYELSPENAASFAVPAAPLWLVHLGEHLPYAYDDAVIDAVMDSAGGISQSLNEALEKLRWSKHIGQVNDKGKLFAISPGYFWYRNEGIEGLKAHPVSSGFSALAADRWINHLENHSDKSQLAALDRVHAIAKRHDILSFYSSMLVLVEERQRQLLKEAEEKDDRFEREVETGEEMLSKPTDPFAVPAVPEPEEWALLIIAFGLLLFAYGRKRGLVHF
ncbi:MAG: TIGR02921 family PEP-CTERM protein [Pseudomonadales bacterium]|nr:TIGR02921 family PEP-CTERM protein [Pseudomonadales bacterium]